MRSYASALSARLLRVLALALGVVLGSGCATPTGPLSAGQKLDPWENWNRKVFAFNEELDVRVLKPVATAYQKVVPSFVRTSITNFFNNAADGWSAVNLFLQGRLEDGLHDMTRFTTNTVFGFLGVIDIASDMGLEHHFEDFGQTLGKWGMRPGAYIVWPLLGPSSVRETIAMPLDRAASPAWMFHGGSEKWSISGVEVVNKRAALLGASRIIDDIALDKYTFVRDAYLARRRSLVFDGDPPLESEPEPEDAGPRGSGAPAVPPDTGAPAGRAADVPAAAPGASAPPAGSRPKR